MNGSVAVFAPSPLLTVTATSHNGNDDIHFHAGGQGFWVARMLATLGVDVQLCAAFGGESGPLIRTLIERERITLKAVPVTVANGSYVHDARSGHREVVAETHPREFSRHELDELYEAALVSGIRADVCVLTGTSARGVVPDDTYRRLASDLTANGAIVVADLSGEQLSNAIAGGTQVVKVSDDELVGDGRARTVAYDDIAFAVHDLRAEGVSLAIVSRAGEPALAAWDEQFVAVTTPAVHALDPRGAGDSMTAGVAASLARGNSIEEALRIGAAAGALNVTRRGLATGNREDIVTMAELVELHAATPPQRTTEPKMRTTTLDELTQAARPK